MKIRRYHTIMRYFLAMLLSSCFGFKKVAEKPVGIVTMHTGSIYDFKMTVLDGDKEISLSDYKGKKMLIVNTASECGYTPQYKELQQLHEKYGDKITILGFPANNFGGQEPGSNKDIKTFCEINYGVTFQMFEKISVKGSDMHPLYQWLSGKDKNGWNDEAPNWNFCKYIISEDGELLKFYSSSVKPMGSEILSDIEAEK